MIAKAPQRVQPSQAVLVVVAPHGHLEGVGVQHRTHVTHEDFVFFADLETETVHESVDFESVPGTDVGLQEFDQFLRVVVEEERTNRG